MATTKVPDDGALAEHSRLIRAFVSPYPSPSPSRPGLQIKLEMIKILVDFKLSMCAKDYSRSCEPESFHPLSIMQVLVF